jgi:hypothetical protein
VGGGHFWWRKGRVSISCYFLTQKFDQDTAGLHAHTIMGRVVHYTERTPVANLVDDFGERALAIYVYASNFFEGGGPPDQYIWRGEVLWQALTSRPL